MGGQYELSRSRQTWALLKVSWEKEAAVNNTCLTLNSRLTSWQKVKYCYTLYYHLEWSTYLDMYYSDLQYVDTIWTFDIPLWRWFVLSGCFLVILSFELKCLLADRQLIGLLFRCISILFFINNIYLVLHNKKGGSILIHSCQSVQSLLLIVSSIWQKCHVLLSIFIVVDAHLWMAARDCSF
jgi:hypothetical protein